MIFFPVISWNISVLQPRPVNSFQRRSAHGQKPGDYIIYVTSQIQYFIYCLGLIEDHACKSLDLIKTEILNIQHVFL